MNNTPTVHRFDSTEASVRTAREQAAALGITLNPQTDPAPTEKPARLVYAQVGKGRTVHYTRSNAPDTTLCKRTASRQLTPTQAARLSHHCVNCTTAIERPAAAPTPDKARTTAPTHRAPAAVESLTEDVTVRPTMFDPALTYFSDGTTVVMRWDGGERIGTAAGRTTDRGPYSYQVVTFDDGTTENVAPHVLHRQAVHTSARELSAPAEAAEPPAVAQTRTAEQTSETAPQAVQEVMHPAAPAIDTHEAARIMSGLWPAARGFEPRHNKEGRLAGYIFAVPGAGSTRFGWITAAGSYAWGLEPYRTDAENMLTAMVAEEDRKAQRPSLAEQRAASVVAYTTQEAARTVTYRAAMDDRVVDEARRHGVPVPDSVAARIAAREQRPAPFAAGDRVVCADGVLRTARGMAPVMPGEPARVIVDGGLWWVADECERAERHAAEEEEAGARLTVLGASTTATAFQPVGAPDGTVIGWTYRTGYGAAIAYGWVTAQRRMCDVAGVEYRSQAEDAIRAHHEAGTLAPTTTQPQPFQGFTPDQLGKALTALRLYNADVWQEPAPRVLEGVIVEHTGTSDGSAPKHAGHPDVIAARAALVRVKPATVTDHAEWDGSEPETRGYLIEPRGGGEVAVFWIEGGRVVSRDEWFHGASLDCLEWSLNKAGWTTEPLRPSATCVKAHAPTEAAAPLER